MSMWARVGGRQWLIPRLGGSVPLIPRLPVGLGHWRKVGGGGYRIRHERRRHEVPAAGGELESHTARDHSTCYALPS